MNAKTFVYAWATMLRCSCTNEVIDMVLLILIYLLLMLICRFNVSKNLFRRVKLLKNGIELTDFREICETTTNGALINLLQK